MRIQLEEHALYDPKVKALGKRLRVTHGDAFYACMRVWFACAGEGGAVLSKDGVDDSCDVSGMAEALAACGLADRLDDGTYRVHTPWKMGGARPLLDAARKGGAARAQQAMRNHSGKFQPADQPQPAVRLESDQPQPAVASSRRTSVTAGAVTQRAPRAAAPPLPGMENSGAAHPLGPQAAIAAFHERYIERTGGHAPTWNGRTTATIARLVKAHTAEEVIRRIGILFDAPPPWMSGTPDVGTLEKFFDKLAAPTRRLVNGQRTYSQEELHDLAAEARTRGE